MGKIVSISELKDIVHKLRKENKTIVTTNGAFDLFHSGHLYSLREAKKHGDILIVLINSDSSIKQYKSEKRPVIEERERAEILAAIDCVDYVCIFAEENPVEMLKIIKPDFHVKGSEYKNNIIEKNIIEENKGRIIFIDRTDISTSKIIKKIKEIA